MRVDRGAKGPQRFKVRRKEHLGAKSFLQHHGEVHHAVPAAVVRNVEVLQLADTPDLNVGLNTTMNYRLCCRFGPNILFTFKLPVIVGQ